MKPLLALAFRRYKGILVRAFKTISVVQLPELSPMPSKTAHKSLIGFLSLGFR